jgi:class 3 adenylate cyclase/tetratricopeptide (TPR) repeat protein
VKACPACGEPYADQARVCQACGRSLTEEVPIREVRKTITVLFTDVTGSTTLGERLDAESLRKVMTRFFEEMASILERHGGSVEKFIGDAVMAVFGVPVVHEDDALRAVRAAAEMRTALRALNDELRVSYNVTLEVRTGINTGEVVAGDLASGQTFVAGDAVNVAARLEQAAPPGEILIGEATYRLVRDAVVVEPSDLGLLRGKTEEVATYRLVDVQHRDGRLPRALRSPMVGRAGELALLRQAFELSRSEEACYLFTILGSAGVGKSRLTDEALEHLDDRATILFGRCLPYGDGITYWSVREIVWQACGIPADADTEEASRAIAARLEGDEHGGRILEGVAQLLALGGAASTPEETYWAFRRFLETLSRTLPVVVVFDDIHWGEPGFLDLVEYLADFTKASVLLVCNARSDLLDVRPAWGAGRQNSMTITLSSLSADEGEILVGNLLGGRETDEAVRRHVVEASEGNPLFVEEIIRMLLDREALHLEDGRWVGPADLDAIEVPPTISAVLAARLERLDEEERAVAQRASVVGKVFYWGAVAALTPKEQRERVGRHLQALVRKDLITPDLSRFTGEDAFRFRHILIRDAAYQTIPKEIRAELHERLATWVEERAGDAETQFEEIVGHHLEQAYRYRQELGLPDERSAALAIDGGTRLASTGRRALDRRDVPAAVNLLRRAAALLPEEHPAHPGLRNDLAQALIDHGDLRGAADMLDRATKAATGDPAVALHAQVSRLWLQLHTEPEGKTETIRQEVQKIIPVLEEMQDERALARASFLLVEIDWMACHYGDAAQTLERVASHAARIGDRRQEMDALARLAAALVYGPVPAEEAIRRCSEIRARARDDRRVEAGVLFAEAELSAMLGRFEGTREMIDRAEAILQDLGLTLMALTSEEVRGAVEMLAGDPVAAERVLRRTVEGLERLGERGFLSTTGAELAQALYAQGRYDEAEHFASMSEAAGASDDVATQLPVRGVRAKVAARRGRLQEGEAMVRAAIDLARPTDALSLRGEASMDLAEVLRLAGRTAEALEALDEAARLFEMKGNSVSAGRARAARAEMAAAPR